MNLVSAFFIIRAKRALEESNKAYVKVVDLPTEALETEMLVWTKYAKRLGDKGFKIMESLLLINDPVLIGFNITLEYYRRRFKIRF
jgi:hypothetical protein